MSFAGFAAVAATVIRQQEAPAPLIFPAWVFPLIAVVIFVVLGVIVWSYRDVANRHSDRIARTGGPASGSGHAGAGHADAGHAGTGHH